MKLVLNSELNLYERKGTAFCTSRQIAEEFGKEHYNILRDIDLLTGSESGLSEEFTALNFEVSKYKDSTGKWNKEYLLTKDGFTILVMGFKGKKAMQFKQTYIERFNKMDSFIQSLQTTRIEFPAFTNGILNAHEEPKHYHFSNEINMIYRIVLGMEAKKFRELHGIEKGESIRPYLSTEQIKAVEALQRVDIGLLVVYPEYEKRKSVLESYFVSQQTKMLKGA